jgi:ADP-ribosylglycohydrolase
MKKFLEYQTYYDRILGGWIGKSLGGIIGAPYECHKQFNKANYDNLWPKELYPNDDLDIQVVWLEALQEIGINPTSRQLAEFWQERCFYTCCEYGIFIDNLEHGIYPPLSGTWNNQFFQNSEGCPIRSEIWGFISPNNPALAMKYATNDGCLDHGTISIELEQFLSVAASEAFFANDPVELFERVCSLVPPNNAGSILYKGVKALCEKYQDEYELWLNIVRKYGDADGTKALINNAFAMMALFKGGNDFKEIMRLCIQIGWDVDCSCATAGALWGAIHGSKAFPQEFLDKMGKTLICACDIKHKYTALTDFAAETAAIGIEVAQVLNPEIEILNAPQVTVRPLVKEAITATYTYQNDEPVLWAQKTNTVTITINNPLDIYIDGEIIFDIPSYIKSDKTTESIKIGPKSSCNVTLSVILKEEEEFIPRLNLIKLSLKQNNQIIFTDYFGFHGATQWEVYGPYFDMWDKEKYEICPYQNEQLNCNPGNIPEFGSDATNCHVRTQFKYLDEATLINEDLPNELPFSIEKGIDKYTRADLYSFNGPQCCYLVREFVSHEKVENIRLVFNASCPFECYLDGKLIQSRYTHNQGSIYRNIENVTFTGKKQRLVVKLVSRITNFDFSLSIIKGINSKTRAYSPHFSRYSIKKR